MKLRMNKEKELTAILVGLYPRHMRILDAHIDKMEKAGELDGLTSKRGYRSEVIRRLISNLESI